MGYQDLREFVRVLRENGELVEIGESLSPCYEIGAALRYLDRRSGKAVLFTNVAGYNCPVVGNLLGNSKRLALALEVEPEHVLEEFKTRTQQLIKPVVVSKGPVQEVVYSADNDLLKVIPALTHHEKDAGPYLTSALVVAVDPDSGERGMGIHRILIKDKNNIGLFLYNPPIGAYFRKAEQRGKPLDIAVVLGVDPALFLASIASDQKGKLNKFEMAGGLKGAPVELVPAAGNGLEIPAYAEFVLLGQVLPGIRESEGPFGESSGYYLTYDNPVAIIHTIMHRQDPLYHALMPYNRENSLLLNLVWQSSYGTTLKKEIPQLTDFRLTSVLGMCALLQIRKTAEGQPKEILEHVLKSNPLIKSAVVVDTDVDLSDLEEVSWAISTRFQPHRDLLVLNDMTGYPLDPSAENSVTSKWGIDATKPLGKEDLFEKVEVPQPAMQKVAGILQRGIPPGRSPEARGE